MNQHQSTTATIPYSIPVQSVFLTTHERLQKANRFQELCFQCITSTQLLFDVSAKYASHIPKWFLGRRCYKHRRGPDTAPEARASRKLVAATEPLQSFESCAVRKDTHAKSWHQCGQKRHTHAILKSVHTKASKFLRSADRGDTWKYCGQSGTTAVRKDTQSQARLQILCGQKRHECKTTLLRTATPTLPWSHVLALTTGRHVTTQNQKNSSSY